jgi:uncharacterized cupin superfamily protein
MAQRENAFTAAEWDSWGDVPAGWCSRSRMLARESDQNVRMSVYELGPGETQCPYHFHHGADELLLVLSGSPTLRTPAGERELEAGEVVYFRRGPEGAHQVLNTSGETTRYVVASSPTSPEIVEYPDSGKIAAMARPSSQSGQTLRTMHLLENEVGYFDGEEPRS